MPKAGSTILKDTNIDMSLNVTSNGTIRHGATINYSPTLSGVRECVAIEDFTYDAAWPAGTSITNKKVAIWDNGSMSMDGTTIAGLTLTLGTSRWPQMVPTTLMRWNAASSSYLPINVIIILTRSKNYIFDPTLPDTTNYVYEIPLAAANVPTQTNAAGTVPAGTYRYIVTEVNYFGAESPVSPTLSCTVAVDSNITVSKGVTVNTDAIRWRVYRSQEGAIAGNEIFRLVGEAPIGTASIIDSRLPSNLGMRLLEGRLPLPVGTSVGCIYRGLLVSSGNYAQNGSIYVSDVSIDETGYSSTGYPEPSQYIAELVMPEGRRVTALVPIGDNLLAFTESSIEVFQGDIAMTVPRRRTLSSTIGTENYRTVAKYGDIVFFMDRSRGNAYATDGNVIEQINQEHLFDGVWYFLKGNQTREHRYELQGNYTANIVVPDVEHGVVMFGGEIVSEADAPYVESGSWQSKFLPNLPRTNRQFVWRVFNVLAKDWKIWTNLHVRSYTMNGSKIHFGDHVGNVWSMKDRYSIDGPETDILCTALITPSDGTTLTLSSGTWTGVVVADSPVTIFNTVTGVSQFRLAVSGTATTLVVDQAVDFTADCIVIYGAPMADVYFQPMGGFAHLREFKYNISSKSAAGRAVICGQVKHDSSLASWANFAKLVPITSNYIYSDLNCRGSNPMIRVTLPAAAYASSIIEVASSVRFGDFTLTGSMIPKERL